MKKDKFESYSWLIFSDEDAQAQAGIRRRRSMTAAAAVLVVSVLVFGAISFLSAGSTEDLGKLLKRSGETRDIDVVLELGYKDISVRQELGLSVLPQEIDRQAAERMFDECETWIRSLFAEGLDFPEKAPNGVSITWEDTDPAYLEMEGPGEQVFIAQLGVGEYFRASEFTAVLDPSDENYRASLAALAEKIADDLSRNAKGSFLELPESSGNVSLSWSLPEKSVPLAIIAAGALLALFIWMRRDDAAERELKKRRQQLEYELPNMSFQMILLLNAGLVAESAFARITQQNAQSRNPLYRAFRDIKRSAQAKNVSFISELYRYARRSGSPDLMRFATLAAEHAGRGASLADKLEQERAQMWNSRVSAAKARVKEAETKLCFPLMLLLVALIIITAAPSFLSM